MDPITTLDQLEENLSTPTERVIHTMTQVEGDLIVLGAGGKMGPSLVRMAARAVQQAGTAQRVLAVSRYSDRAVAEQLESWGVETISGDLMDPHFVDSLPDVPNVVYMAGRKFGTDGAESQTWAANTLLPSLVAQKFCKSRIVAFSTGNVYEPAPIDGPGSLETDRLLPNGEYGMSCLGRERIFEYFSQKFQTPVAIIRLNYATELRYGVLVDLAQRVWAEEPVPLECGYFNTIWQTDANAMTLCALQNTQTPPLPLNVTGPKLHSCRIVAQRLGELMDKPVRFEGTESAVAFHTCTQRATDLYGKPLVQLEEMLVATADWVSRGGPVHGKPTHFEVVDGKY